MASILTAPLGLLGQPLFTGPLLLALTSGPEALRGPLLHQLESFITKIGVSSITTPRVITALKVLLALGLGRRVNRALNAWALNNWRWRAQTDKWTWNWEVAVVTGGSSGIGLETVRLLSRKGVKVAVLDIQDLPESVQNYSNIKFFYCDVTSPDSISEAAAAVRKTWDHPSILINNAGIGGPHSLVEMPTAWVSKIFTINIVSHFWLIKEFLPNMIAKDKGHIVGLASMASWVAPPGIVDYAATKAAVTALHEGLNMEIRHLYKTPGVLNTIVHPSWVRTPLVGGFEDHLEKTQGGLMKPEWIAQKIVKQIVSCRGGQLIIPSKLASATRLRGEANWIQELIRDFAVGGAASEFPDQAKKAAK
ncbi:dehydrogenase/reductase SDR family member 8 precursor [Trichodelitschia bisporula]|uniref:Short-chain dehydrogenase/reductase 3 n=1 Tax=Trichodelitschia bisporula TaxID=703511 RepID=A0A6G1HQE5_9PEZI|nr:dehydrogenase/reductase SDR family member 8 precursor [Trichodelitschia bisporula]